MPITLTITGNTGPEAVQEIFNFLGNLHANLNIAAGAVVPSNTSVIPANAIATPVAEDKPKKAKKVEKEEVKPEVSPKATLQQAIDRAKEIAGDGEDAKVMATFADINKRFGIGRVRELPPEKLDAYMEELDRAFPKAVNTGGMFD